MNSQIRKDKIAYLNDISRLNNKPLKGAELLLAYEGFNKNLSIKECIEYINDNKELKEKELEEERKKVLHKKEKQNETKTNKIKRKLIDIKRNLCNNKNINKRK